MTLVRIRTMNKIRAEYRTTEFTNGEHLVMMIDDVQLDKIISATGKESHMTGLVSINIAAI